MLWAENVMAYKCFHELMPDRITGFGEGFIPRRAIRDYADEKGLDFDELLFKVRQLDVAYLQHRKERQEREREMKQREQERRERMRGGRR